MAEQAIIQDTKEKFQAAYDYILSEKESAEKSYNEETEMGLTEYDFYSWAAANYPSFSAAKSQYEAARANYENALKQYDLEGFEAWKEKEKDLVYNNLDSDGRQDPNLLYGPDE